MAPLGTRHFLVFPGKLQLHVRLPEQGCEAKADRQQPPTAPSLERGQTGPKELHMKAILWIVGIIFLIGLLVVLGIGGLIF